MKLKDKGIIWIDDSSMYVADKSLFPDAAAFLEAVSLHIHDLMTGDNWEAECGWCVEPTLDRHLAYVTTAYMVHRLNMEYEWWMEEEPGPGHRAVWCIDFEKGR